MSKKSGFDYHELINFADNLRDQPPQLELEKLMVEYAKDFLKNAKIHTPVDTGNLRKHWDIDNPVITVRKLKNGYSVTLYNKAKNKYGYMYGRDVDQGHQSYNQFGGPYVVKHSKYGLNGGPVIGRFFIEKAEADSDYHLRRVVAKELQKWLDRCVENAK